MVLARLGELKQNINSFELTQGWPQGYLRAVVRTDDKRTVPNIERAKTICDALDLEFYIGRPRSTEPTSEIDGERFATVARFEASAAAGDGHINLDDDPVDHLAFSQNWLLQNGIRPDTCFLITVRGDSMAPVISDGDLVMIDRRKTAITSGQVYVFNQPGDGTRIKRLELVPGAALIIRSDNPDQDRYPPEYYIGDDMNHIAASVLGQVIWSGHTWK